jgi:hypothetical protein
MMYKFGCIPDGSGFIRDAKNIEVKMKRLLWALLFAFPVFANAQGQVQEPAYPWMLTIFGGGALLCTDANSGLAAGQTASGCFGPSGYTFGASFGRGMTDTWSFELEFAYANAKETLPPAVDIPTGILYEAEFTHGRVWAGGTFFGKIARFSGGRNNIFIALGGLGAYERQTLTTPPEVFHEPSLNIGVTGGVCAGIGMNFAIAQKWSIRPELRYYLAASGLSGLRYSAGITKTF